MRTPLLLISLLFLRVCGADLGPNALVAHHGGVVVPFESHAVEVVARSDGEVEAWVVDGEATLVPSQTVVVVVPTATAPQEVTLAWDPATSSYKGRAPEPVVEGAIDVRLTIVGAAPVTARAEHIVIAAPAPTVVISAPPSVTVVAPERPRVEVSAPRARVEVSAPSPTVVVSPPRPGVVVVPPSPPGIVIVPPSPPGVVVVPPRPGVVIEHDRGRHRGHGRGHDHHDHGGTVVVTPPRGPGVSVRGGGHHGRGRH